MGVDRNVLERFLTLIRDYYDKVDKATFFLEVRTGNVNVSGIKNVRGILSHLVMLLDPNAPPERRTEQLVNAEGHLRRAITEPYEIALDSLTVTFADIYDRYKRDVLPVSDQHGSLRSAPNSGIVGIRLDEIRDLESKGREAKDKDLRDPAWESGVSCLVAAFEKLFSLKSEMEGYCNAFDNMQEEEARQEKLRTQLREEIHQDLSKESKRSARLHFFEITIGVLGIVIAVLLVVFPSLGVWIRNVLHTIVHLGK
jgi:hypothetical protein